MNFVAIDIETANADMASICQIGIAKYVEGQLIAKGQKIRIIKESDFKELARYAQSIS